MARIRWTFYTGLALTALHLGASGCGKPAPPPPDAPKGEQTEPQIEFGAPSNSPKESEGAQADSSPASRPLLRAICRVPAAWCWAAIFTASRGPTV